MKKSQQGFTSSELVIVVVIIAIFAAVALPAYQNHTKRAHVMEGLALAEIVQTAVAKFHSSTGNWPAENTAAGLEVSNRISGNAVKSVAIRAGALIIIEYNHKVSEGALLALRADAAGSGSIRWYCGYADKGNGTYSAALSTDIEAKYLPANCRKS